MACFLCKGNENSTVVGCKDSCLDCHACRWFCSLFDTRWCGPKRERHRNDDGHDRRVPSSTVSFCLDLHNVMSAARPGHLTLWKWRVCSIVHHSAALFRVRESKYATALDMAGDPCVPATNSIHRAGDVAICGAGNSRSHCHPRTLLGYQGRYQKTEHINERVLTASPVFKGYILVLPLIQQICD